MFVRKKKNRSGTISVVVVDKSRGKFREVKKFGVASTDEEADALVKDAQLWLHRYGGMQYLDFDGTDKTEADIDYALTHILAYVKLYITYLESARAIWRRDLCSILPKDASKRMSAFALLLTRYIRNCRGCCHHMA